MHSCEVLTTGLLRVELAPEEYQLYSEGCGQEKGVTVVMVVSGEEGS